SARAGSFGEPDRHVDRDDRRRLLGGEHVDEAGHYGDARLLALEAQEGDNPAARTTIDTGEPGHATLRAAYGCMCSRVARMRSGAREARPVSRPVGRHARCRRCRAIWIPDRIALRSVRDDNDNLKRPTSPSSSRPGRSARRAVPEAARERGYKPRPQVAAPVSANWSAL